MARYPYKKEARAILSKALEERCPATAEAVREARVLTPHEGTAVEALAALLRAVDLGMN